MTKQWSHKAFVISHEMSAVKNECLHIARGMHPVRVFCIQGRSATAKPQCPPGHCLWYTWKVVVVTLGLRGVLPKLGHLCVASGFRTDSWCFSFCALLAGLTCCVCDVLHLCLAPSSAQTGSFSRLLRYPNNICAIYDSSQVSWSERPADMFWEMTVVVVGFRSFHLFPFLPFAGACLGLLWLVTWKSSASQIL